jgi:hypothetical protein
MKLTQ